MLIDGPVGESKYSPFMFGVVDVTLNIEGDAEATATTVVETVDKRKSRMVIERLSHSATDVSLDVCTCAQNK